MGEEEIPLIYGLELQARSLAVELAENEVTRFMVGTQTLKMANNQIHVVEVNDETSIINAQVYNHPVGELWHLHWSPHDSLMFSSTFSHVDDETNVLNKCAIWTLPPSGQELEEVAQFKGYDNVKMSVFHPTEKEKFAMICENKFVVWDLGNGTPKEVFERIVDQKGHTKITGGKWNPQESGAHLCTFQDTNVKGWDLRSPTPAWSLDQAHSYLVRDVDYNRNRCHTLASCGDDCLVNIWDLRNASTMLKLTGHSHWVWSLRYNHLQDELLLSSSSDARVILWWVGSVASEPNDRYPDGKLVDFSDHEDSVYRLEWSNVDPWLFAALSYDGRLLIDRVPRKHKYNILDIS